MMRPIGGEPAKTWMLYIESVEAERDRYREALVWALGGPGSDFRHRLEGEGAYYWRKELSQRAGLEWDGEKYISVKE